MSSESETNRDGAFSYPAEWHAFVYGMYDGITSLRFDPGHAPDNPDVDQETHYYKGGFVVGTVFQWSAVLLIFALT